MDKEIVAVSVIITTFKGENCIKNAVDSVLNQTLKNIECIVVDDNGKGSSSQIKTEEILRTYINEKKIIYIPENTNTNASVARNIGVHRSKGKYISFLDDDDVFYEDKLLTQYECLEKNSKYDICYCKLLDIVEGKGQYIGDARITGDFTFDFLMMRVSVCTSTLFISRKIFDEVGGFNESFKRHQDWEFISRLSLISPIIGVDYIGTKKYTRNITKRFTAYEAEKFRLYFINNIPNVIASLTKKEKKKFFCLTYQELAKLFFRDKVIFRGLKYLVKSKHPITFFIKILKKRIGKKKNANK